MNGGEGDDELIGGFSDDKLDGGNGSNDLAIFEYSRKHYHVTTVNDVTTVIATSGDDTDTITNVEHFKFGSEVFDKSNVNDVDYFNQNITIVPPRDTVPTVTNQPPIITGTSSIDKTTNQSFDFTSLISASDPDGTVVSYKFSDATPGKGYLTLNNQRITDTSVTVSAANLGLVGYFTDLSPGNNKIAIDAIDNLGGSDSMDMTINIESNDTPPPSEPGALSVIYASDFSLAEGNSGTKTSNVRVYLNKAASTDVSFSYFVASQDSVGWAKRDSDFKSQSDTTTIKAGSTYVDLKVPVIGDTKVEGDESIWITLSSAKGASFPNGERVIVINGKIRDDDVDEEEPTPLPPPPSAGPIYLELQASDIGLEEGADGVYTEFDFRVIRTGDLSVKTNFDYEVQGYGSDPATAEDFVDGVFPSGSDSLSIGDTKEVFTVRVKGDLTNEPNEAFRVKLYAASPGVQVTDSTAMVTIRNDDGYTTPSSAGQVYVSIRPYDSVKSEGTATNGRTTFTFELTRSGDLNQETLVDINRADGSGTTPQADNQDDFDGQQYWTTFSIGQDTTYIEVDVEADSLNEPDEPFEVSLSRRTGYENVEFPEQSAQGLILNDDGPTPPLITAPSIAVHETDQNQTANLRVQLSAATSVPVTMDYEVYAWSGSNAPTSSDIDFVPQTGVVTIPSGSTYVDIPISIFGDDLTEPIEVVDVRLSDPINGYFGRSIDDWDTSIVILDDDGGVSWPGDEDLLFTDYIDLGTISLYSSLQVNFWLDATIPHQVFRFAVDEPMPVQVIQVGTPLVFSSDGKLIYSSASRVDNIELAEINWAIGEGRTFQPGAPYFLVYGINGTSEDVSRSFQLNGAPTEDKLPLLHFSRELSSGGGLEVYDGGLEGYGTFWNVRPSHIVDHDITFDVEFRSLTATKDTDFKYYKQDTVTIPAGEYISTNFVSLVADNEFEGDETFEVVIKNIQGAVLPNGSTEISSIYTIIDDDPSPIPLFQIKSQSADRAEGTTTNGKFIFEISRPYGGSDIAGSVDWTVSGAGSNQATASDFIGSAFPSGTLTFDVGEVSKTLTIEVTADTIAELDEGFKVELSNPSNGFQVFNGNVQGTIRNDDGLYVSGYLNENEVESAVSYQMSEQETTFLASGVSPLDVVGNALENHIFGNNAANWMEGGEGDDSLIGEDGNDTLDGGIGSDGLEGGQGDDRYHVDNLYDEIYELPDRGMDVVYASVNYVLSPNIEKLFLDGTLGISGTGNDLNNTIIGNDHTNQLMGQDGNDALEGGLGNDTINGGTGADTAQFTGTLDSASFDYSPSINTFTVTMINGDIDIVTNIETFKFDDQAVEAYTTVPANSFDADFYLAKYGDLREAFGVDKTLATKHFVMNGYREGRIFDNIGNDKLTGSAFNDSLNAGTGSDTITGGDGNDMLKGGEGNDAINGGNGADIAVFLGTFVNATINYSSDTNTFTITTDNGEVDTAVDIEAFKFDDQAVEAYTTVPPSSFDANFYLAKYDDLRKAFDVDKASATRHFVLNGYTEGRIITNTGDDKLTGSAINDSLNAGTGNDTLTGGDGNDILTGGENNDILDGGEDNDQAVYFGDWANYTITATETGYTIIDNIGNEGIDTLINIEELAFADQTIVLANTAPTLATPISTVYTDTASDDTFSAATGILAGTDVDSDTLNYGISEGIDGGTTVSKAGIYGTLVVTKASGAYTFTPDDAAIEGLKNNTSETFTVTVSDGTDITSAIVTVDLTGAIDPVTFRHNVTQIVYKGDPESVADGLIISDRDNDGDTHFIPQNNTLGAYGTFSVVGYGIWDYTLDNSLASVQDLKPAQGIVDTFNVATINGVIATVSLLITGGTSMSGNNWIIAESGDNIIDAGGGDNQIITGPGADNITTGGGKDIIKAGAGNNHISAGAGKDKIITLDGDDIINTGKGDDIIFAGDGNNTVAAGNGDNEVTSGLGNDIIITGSGTDTINAGDGNNKVNTLGGDDNITTGNGNDTINAGEGANQIDAGNGINKIESLSGDDIISSGTGKDIIKAGGGNNHISAGAEKNKVTTLDGDDTIITGKGNDTLSAGDGNNTVAADSGHNQVTSGRGNDIITTKSGIDTINAGDGNNKVSSLGGADNITTGNGKDTIYAGNGNNIINSGAATDKIVTGNGNDIINSGTGADKLTGGAGNDRFVFDNVSESGTDTIFDFLTPDDVLVFKGSVFTAVAGGITSDNLRVGAGAVAQDSNDYFIFDTNEGNLFYDVDGSGAGTAIQIVSLIGVTALDINNLLIE